MYFVLALAAFLVALYFYFYIRQIFGFFGADVKKLHIRIIVAVVAALFGAAAFKPFGFLLVAVLHILLISALLRLVNYIIKRIARERYDGFKLYNRIYKSGAAVLIIFAIIMTAGYINLHNIVSTEYTVYTDKNIRDNGYRVVLISDVHFGVSVDYDELSRICSEISGKEPDIVILCGDIVDNNTTRGEMHQVFKAFGGIKSELGIFYVHGNHDRPFGFAGFESGFSESELCEAIESNGIVILQDEICSPNDEIILVGREDRSARSRKSVADLLKGADTDKLIITLDHQPREYDLTAASATDIVLSGHTHGGQIWPLKQVQEIFKMNDKVYGHGYLDDDTQYIVSSGLAGWAYPIKTASPAEYVVIDISEGRE